PGAPQSFRGRAWRCGRSAPTSRQRRIPRGGVHRSSTPGAGTRGVGSCAMTPPGLAQPPPLGASALPPGAYDGRVVVVTGGGTGLGKAIATEFGRLGAAVGIVSRNAEHRAAGVAAVEGAGARALAGERDIPEPPAI